MLGESKSQTHRRWVSSTSPLPVYLTVTFTAPAALAAERADRLDDHTNPTASRTATATPCRTREPFVIANPPGEREETTCIRDALIDDERRRGVRPSGANGRLARADGRSRCPAASPSPSSSAHDAGKPTLPPAGCSARGLKMAHHD